jgi:cytochrome P450/NADPH-cytochrome P450 reductase
LEKSLGQLTDFVIVLLNKVSVKSNDIGRERRHVEIMLSQGQTYRTGDYLAVLPTNPVVIVFND